MCENGRVIDRRQEFPDFGGNMAELALRAVAVAGVLSVGVLCGIPGAAPAPAQPTDPDGSSQDSGSTESGGDQTPSEGSDADARVSSQTTDPDPDPDPDPVTIEDAEEEFADAGGSTDRDTSRQSPALLPPAQESKKTEYSGSLTLPFFRLPAPDEIPEGSWPSVSSFYTTVEIPLPTLGDFLTALGVVPPPPPPGPSIRIQQEAPVLDAGTGTAGGVVGGGSSSGGGTPVFQAPLMVSVPRAMTVAGPGPRARAPRPGTSAEQATTAPGVAGVRTPRIRGSVAPTPGTSVAPSVAPMSASGQMPRPAGYPRVLTGPTLAEIAAVALPGLAGLMLVTFGGAVIGYRQANSLRFVRTAGAERFLA